MRATRFIRGACIGVVVLFSGGCRFSIRGSPPTGGDGVGDAPPPVVSGGLDFAVAVDLGEPGGVASAAPDMATLPAHVGDGCNGQCGDGLTCMTWLAAGYCSRACTSDGDCPNGSSCVDAGDGGQFCLLDSSGDKCTRTDLRCIDCGAKVCGPSSFCDAC